MPERPLTIVGYAAGASLAAITLVYVFGPTFFLDGESGQDRTKKGIVGLSNPANDCFINSILQALAGLSDLRIYLIREVHRRNLDGEGVYKVTEEDLEEERKKRPDIKSWFLEGLRQGLVTQGLKEVLDNLNERPLYRKTISAQSFIQVVEHAFKTRVSRQQQDAQEFLQIVTERVCDEYHAGQRARRSAKRRGQRVAEPPVEEADALSILEESQIKPLQAQAERPNPDENTTDAPEEDSEDKDDEEGFPFEGKIESQIECTTCHFMPKPSISTFVTLTLNVPQTSHTSLDSCFDGMLKTETIDDFKCEKCRLMHARELKEKQRNNSQNEDERSALRSDMIKLQTAVDTDPEKPPSDVELPPLKDAPKRRIKRHMRIAQFPKILAIHLSRSIYSASSYSTKNNAKVSFPESLPLGTILDRKQYKLLATVTHKGGHNSGHYETFRRQVQPQPFSTPTSFGAGGAYSPNPSAVPSPRLSASRPNRDNRSSVRLVADATLPSSALDSPSSSSLSSRSSAPQTSTQDGAEEPETPASSVSQSQQPRRSMSTRERVSNLRPSRLKKKDRWWRISDDKVKESKTGEVLGMQKEVYLLFYELER